ncbi:hypothetical protein SALBM217S_01192 [Streptomyces griseoloalbus]
MTGAGVALDAAARGLRVAAVDAHDLAFGTWRFSSTLVHGGLRYLAFGRLDVAHEGAVARGIVMERTGPHLVHAQRFVLPLAPLVSRGQDVWRGPRFRAGDALRLAARTARAALPGAAPAVRGGDPPSRARAAAGGAAQKAAVVGRTARRRRPAGERPGAYGRRARRVGPHLGPGAGADCRWRPGP